ncbi:NADP-binding protein [Dacryopinax primogenitus]|uniref:NADP-binding protein n=1 Tax=Dacryopinax primogenitus (strain DJM 731) TaxID=1858805 RepID=M5FPM5_DACPD|nr:NADP-binding protein [Dacryopinax primogenitus]EJT98665.1 NADP-binding protein [Dacryopinax primogenitus]
MAPGPETKNKILRVGLVGTGSVAQVIHLPVLALMSHLFKVTALCDISAQSRAHSAQKWGITKTYESSKDLCADRKLLIFRQAPVAREAIAQGKHVFIEKPMCLTLEDADTISAAANKAGVVAFVGYMRRYAPALQQAIDLVGGLEKNAFFIPQSGTFPLAFTDFPPNALTARQSLEESIYARALGPRAQDAQLRALLRFLGGLGAHDLSVMRQVLGMPVSRFVSAMFDYGSFVCTYETGVDQVGRFDACVEVFGGDKRVKLDYDTPFIKGLPIHIIKIIPTFEDPYTLEMKELWDAIVEGKEFKSTVEDARKEVEIWAMIVDALPKQQ